MSYQSYRKETRSRDSNCCCRVMSAIALILLIAAAVVVAVWLFVLSDESKDEIKNVFNDTLTGDGENNEVSGGGGGSNNENGGTVDDSSFQFMQCGSSPDCCNGLDSICDLPANKIMYAGLHNAMATDEDGFFIAPNHDFKLESALLAGYRAINLDIAVCNGQLKLVHGFCGAGSRDPQTVFTNIYNFLTDFPSEVVIISLQIDNDANNFGDGEDVTLDSIDGIFQRIDGFKSRMYSYTIGVDWPTLRELVEMDKRIILGHYNGRELCSQDGCPSGFHDWFRIGAESAFEFESVSDIENTAMSCEITRGNQFSDGFWGINVFLELPSKSAAKEVNSLEFMENHISECMALNQGRDLNIVFVDFWKQGDLPEVVQRHNTDLAQ